MVSQSGNSEAEELGFSVHSYRKMVTALVKPGADILGQLTASDCNLLHMAIGVSGEAGELLDAVKKATIYRKPIDRANVIEELGDIEFFLEGIRQELGISRDATLMGNIAKLGKRYAALSYSDAAARDRADKS
jgi:NTP pyrophosphatase (non-canonical NTP hydrolase)